jgi:hypothetical protein
VVVELLWKEIAISDSPKKISVVDHSRGTWREIPPSRGSGNWKSRAHDNGNRDIPMRDFPTELRHRGGQVSEGKPL